jgi:hypothetical protein
MHCQDFELPGVSQDIGAKRAKSAWRISFVKLTAPEKVDFVKCLDTLARGLHSWF